MHADTNGLAGERFEFVRRAGLESAVADVLFEASTESGRGDRGERQTRGCHPTGAFCEFTHRGVSNFHHIRGEIGGDDNFGEFLFESVKGSGFQEDELFLKEVREGVFKVPVKIVFHLLGDR